MSKAKAQMSKAQMSKTSKMPKDILEEYLFSLVLLAKLYRGLSAPQKP